MSIFKRMAEMGHEQIIFCQNKKTRLKAIIAIHDTTMGPALGGCRMRPYETEEEALDDVLRLSRGMTYKCGIADADNGGGKSVIIGDPNGDKTPELFRAFGRYVGGLRGRFYTGTDMGTQPIDFVHAKRESEYFVGLPVEHGGSGDTSIPTALGVLQGIRATAFTLWGSTELSGRTFAIQGVGKVGERLVHHLVEEGAKLILTDVYRPNLEKVAASVPAHQLLAVVEPDDIHRQFCDMYVPCALGGVINDQTISELKCQAVVGSANNQLLEKRHGEELQKRGILYAPDYLVNAGGLIQVADELMGANPERVLAKTQAIYDMLLQVYRLSREEHIPTWLAADRLVEEKIATVADLKSIFC